MMQEHDHDHSHDVSNDVAGLQGSPKTMFFLGLFVGLAAFAILTLSFVMWSIFSGKGLSLGAGTQAGTQQVAAQNPSPSPTPSQQQQQQEPTLNGANLTPGHFPLKGKSDAKVTVVEFADFRCPFCERFYNDTNKQLDRDYVNTGKVKFAFRSFAFLGQASTDASMAAECANEQGQFWKMHDWLYENQADESNTAYYSKENLIKYAASIGLNKDKFASCINSDKYASQVQQDLTDGQAAGVSGTPTTFINGKAIVGAVPYAQIKAAVEAALAK